MACCNLFIIGVFEEFYVDEVKKNLIGFLWVFLFNLVFDLKK